MARVKSKAIPSDISEDYYQLGIEVLQSFPKYRIPVDLFAFNESIAVLVPYSRKDQRLSNEQVEEVHNLCKNSLLFVSRSDLPIYSEHLVKQLDLVLQDAHLKEAEVADICMRALMSNFADFCETPLKPVFEPLYTSTMVVTEWLWQDTHRIKYFLRRLQHNYTLEGHSFNSLAVGLWLCVQTNKELKRREFDRIALALLLHDIGMGKIPPVIRGKPRKLNPDETNKIHEHPIIGYKIMQKLELTFNELGMCTMEHHERLDGSGYPQRLKDKQISPLGRLCAVTDAFCAMITERPFDKAKAIELAAKELVLDEARFDKKYSAQLMIGIANKVFAPIGN